MERRLEPADRWLEPVERWLGPCFTAKKGRLKLQPGIFLAKLETEQIRTIHLDLEASKHAPLRHRRRTHAVKPGFVFVFCAPPSLPTLIPRSPGSPRSDTGIARTRSNQASYSALYLRARCKRADKRVLVMASSPSPRQPSSAKYAIICIKKGEVRGA